MDRRKFRSESDHVGGSWLAAFLTLFMGVIFCTVALVTVSDHPLQDLALFVAFVLGTLLFLIIPWHRKSFWRSLLRKRRRGRKRKKNSQFPSWQQTKYWPQKAESRSGRPTVHGTPTMFVPRGRAVKSKRRSE